MKSLKENHKTHKNPQKRNKLVWVSNQKIRRVFAKSVTTTFSEIWLAIVLGSVWVKSIIINITNWDVLALKYRNLKIVKPKKLTEVRYSKSFTKLQNAHWSYTTISDILAKWSFCNSSEGLKTTRIFLRDSTKILQIPQK